MNVNFANIQLILLVHIGDNRSTSCRLCSDKLDYHFRKSVLVKRWSILNTYTLNLKVPWIKEILQWVSEQWTGIQSNQINDRILTLVLENPLHVFSIQGCSKILMRSCSQFEVWSGSPTSSLAPPTTSRPSVLLFGFAGSKKHQLEKHSKLYNDLGFHTLYCILPLQHLFHYDIHRIRSQQL